MNNKFKRALSSVLAFVMACSSLIVMNVSSVFAADTTNYIVTAESLPDGSNSYFYDLLDTTGKILEKTQPTDPGLYWCRGGSSDAIAADDSPTSIDGLTLQNGITSGSNNKGLLGFYANSGDTIKVYFKPSNKATVVGITNGYSTNVLSSTSALVLSEATSDTSSIISLEYTAVSDGFYCAGCTANKAKFYAVTITPASGEAHEYTVSGTSNLPNTTFTIGNGYTVTTDSEGNWTLTVSSVAIPFSVGDTLDVSLLNYSANSITLTGGTDEYSFNGGNITFEKIEAENVSEAVGEISLLSQSSYADGAVISKYFTIDGSGITGDSSYVSVAKDNGIKFTTTVPLKVSVKCSSTGSSNTSYLNVKDSVGTDIYENTSITGSTSAAAYVTVSENLAAGEYEIYVPSSASRATRLFSVKFEEPVSTVDPDPVDPDPVDPDPVDPSDAASFDYWFDTASSTAAGTYTLAGSTVTLYADFAAAQSYTYDGHKSYAGTPAKATAGGANIGSASAIAPDAGSAYSFVPAADGTITFYSGTASGKTYSIVTKDTEGNLTLNATADTAVTVAGKAGYTYYVFGNSSTSNSAFIGFQYIVDKQADVTFTADDTTTLGTATITATDNATGDKVTLNTDGTATTINVGHTYTISSSDPSLEVKINGSNVFTVEDGVTAYTINVSKYENVTLSGTITSDTGATGFVTSLAFVNKISGNSYAATVNADGTYSAELPAGEYDTAAVTNNGMTTINQVSVPITGKTDEEVYFVSGEFAAKTYAAADLEAIAGGTSDSILTFANINTHGGGHGPSAGSSSTITVALPQAATVKVTVSYSGNFTISGNGESVSAATETNGTTATATYTAPGAETATIAFASQSYVYEIVVTPIGGVEFTSTINVPGDYPTVTAALKAINAMSRPEGEAGRVTINLTANSTEQVHVDAPYVTLNGNGNTIDWYYALPCSYYSMDANGFYNEELARDKYTKNPAKTAYWGGVVIVDASDFYATNVTFKNTFNYEVTAREIADGAEFNGAYCGHSAGELRADVTTDPKTYAEKERSNALILTANSDRAEFYNVSILSSQDTLGYNGAHTAKAYFKDCTIGGNVDFICGAGDLVFDNCTLQLLGYSDKAGTGYITAAKATKYLFRNCTVTASDYGYTTDTYYGRPWDQAADVKFINTKTNGLVVSAGWDAMSSNTVAAATGFGEYQNRGSDGTEFNSTASKTLTDADYLALDDTAYLGDWTPRNYIPGVVDVNDGVIVDQTGNIIVYGEIPATAVDTNNFAGFALSTAYKLFDQEQITSDTVYEALVYTDTEGVEQTVTPTEGNYIVAVLIEGATGSGVLNIRGINGIVSTAPVYNDFVAADFAVSE